MSWLTHWWYALTLYMIGGPLWGGVGHYRYLVNTHLVVVAFPGIVGSPYHSVPGVRSEP